MSGKQLSPEINEPGKSKEPQNLKTICDIV